MSYRRLAEALLQGQPYFGPALRSLQGFPERHRYILPVVKGVAARADVKILEIGSWAGTSAISWASALKKLGSAIRLNEEEIPLVAAIFARCLAVKSHRRVANE